MINCNIIFLLNLLCLNIFSVIYFLLLLFLLQFQLQTAPKTLTYFIKFHKDANKRILVPQYNSSLVSLLLLIALSNLDLKRYLMSSSLPLALPNPPKSLSKKLFLFRGKYQCFLLPSTFSALAFSLINLTNTSSNPTFYPAVFDTNSMPLELKNIFSQCTIRLPIKDELFNLITCALLQNGPCPSYQRLISVAFKPYNS